MRFVDKINFSPSLSLSRRAQTNDVWHLNFSIPHNLTRRCHLSRVVYTQFQWNLKNDDNADRSLSQILFQAYGSASSNFNSIWIICFISLSRFLSVFLRFFIIPILACLLAEEKEKKAIWKHCKAAHAKTTTTTFTGVNNVEFHQWNAQKACMIDSENLNKFPIRLHHVEALSAAWLLVGNGI